MVSEIISSVLLLASPWIIKGLTNFVKKIQSVQISNNKVFILRFVVAILSFSTVVATAWISGTDVSADMISSFAETVIVFLGATGAYFFEKKSV